MRTAVIDASEASKYSGSSGSPAASAAMRISCYVTAFWASFHQNTAAIWVIWAEKSVYFLVDLAAGLADVGKYDPAMFSMPIPNLNPGEVVEMTVSYFETLDYIDNQYIVSVPLAFDSVSLA